MFKPCLLLVCLAVSIAAALPELLVPPLHNEANGHDYILLDRSDWENAEAAAVALGGHLATVRNSAEQQWLLTTFGRYGGQHRLLWIGLNNLKSVSRFEWVSGEPVTYTEWASGEPNNADGNERYVALYYPGFNQPGAWNDWNSRTADPIGIPFHGVVELIPQLRITHLPDGNLELSWPLGLPEYFLEATDDLSKPFSGFQYERVSDTVAGRFIVTIIPTSTHYIRLRQ
ncbi:MAG: C-type lectin domain-containing protein [Verrucomicrobiota bacterium]|nr:C-type lectin domain-containing protein [Verrucomicrobiota bacterium]